MKKNDTRERSKDKVNVEISEQFISDFVRNCRDCYISKKRECPYCKLGCIRYCIETSGNMDDDKING